MGGIFHYSKEKFSFALLQRELEDMLNSVEGQISFVMAPKKISSQLNGMKLCKVIHYADRAGGLTGLRRICHIQKITEFFSKLLF